MPISSSVRLLIAGLAASLACGGSTEPEPEPAGNIRVSVDTDGFEIDPDGYSVSIDGGAARALPTNGFFVAQNLAPGEHAVAISGIAPNCELQGQNPATVTVVDGATSDVEFYVVCAFPDAPEIVATVPLAGRPYGATISPSGVIYVALIGTSHLQRGNLATKGFGPTVEVGSTPPHVVFTPDGNRVYATLQTGQGVAVVDPATNTRLTTIPLLADGFNLIAAPDGQRVYATDAAGRLYAIDVATNTIVGQPLMVGAAANGLAFSPNGATLYVSSRDAGTITAVSTATFTIARTYPVGGMPQRLAVSPDGATLYAANETSGLNVVNLASGSVTSYSFGTAAYGLGLEPSGELLYVLLAQAGMVVVIERQSLQVVDVLDTGGTPRNVTFDATGTTALVTTEESVVFIERP